MTRNVFRNFGNIIAIDIIFTARVSKRNMGGPNDETVLLTEIKPLFQAPRNCSHGQSWAACLLTAGSNVHVLLAVFFLGFLRWLKFTASTRFACVVVFLIGLHASARMTACCACPGVGFIVIPFFVFFAHARRRQDKQLSHFFCGRSAGQTRTASSCPHYLEAACMCRWNSLD